MDLTKVLCLRLAKPLKGLARARKGLARVVQAYALGLSLCLIGASIAEAPSAEALGLSAKQYASKTLNNKNHFKCLNRLYSKESAWNPKARNGSHYGIPQGNSIYLKTANQYEQITWGIKYINHRYGNPCKAYAHFMKYNWH